MSVKSKLVYLRGLLYLQEVVKWKSISVAATKNGIKASNLSHTLKMLERDFGVKLFLRRAYGITPTTEAYRLVERLQPLEQMFESLELCKASAEKSNILHILIDRQIEIDGLENFLKTENIRFARTESEEDADVIVSGNCPKNAASLISVENYIGDRIRQTVWVCVRNRPDSLLVARFIIDRMHAL
jgi:DNA-binding HxlR family transcriptional regulator